MSQPNTYQTSIMFTDIVGYSGMINKNEKNALSLLDEHNKIIFPIIKTHSGEIIKLIGDAIFARFPNPNDSVNAATIIQNTLEERNSVSTKENKIHIRIGLHTGNVIEKDDDLFGHDVNLCSRIEPLSPKGCIAASGELISSLEKNHSFLYREMGYIKLKNISSPHQIFKIYNNDNQFEKESDKQLQQYLKDNEIEIIDINSYDVEETFSVGVLYTTNIGPKEDESISYSLTEDLIDDLGYINNIRLPFFNEIIKYKNSDLHTDDIARTLQVNNILEGSVLKDGTKIKLNFKLISIDSGKILWQQKWIDNVSNIKSIRKHIIDAILTEFELDFPEKLIKYFSEEMSEIPEAIEEYNAGKYCMDCLETNDDIKKAKGHFEKALELDNGFVEAYYMLSMSNKRLGYFEDAETALGHGEEIAEEHDNTHGKSYIYRGYKNLYTSWGKYEKAKIYIVKALKEHLKLSHPTFETFLRLDYANCLNNLFQVESSIEQSNLAIEMLKKNENTRHLGIAYANLSETNCAIGDFSKSLEIGKKGLAMFKKEEIANNTAVMLLWLAETYYRTGMYEEMYASALEAEEILHGLDDYFRQGKINYFKYQYAIQQHENTIALQCIEKSIENYNLSQNTVFEIFALIEKLHILIESNNTAQIDSTLSKIQSLSKQTKGSYTNFNFEAMKLFIELKNDTNKKDQIDSLVSDLDKEKDNWNLFNFHLSYWYIARAYYAIGEEEASRECHKKAKSIIEQQAENISGDTEKECFLNSYINTCVMKEITSEEAEISKPKENKPSVFAFCPSCGFKNENSFVFCPSCGNDLKQ